MIPYNSQVKCADLRSFFPPFGKPLQGEVSTQQQFSPRPQQQPPCKVSPRPQLIRETSRGAYENLCSSGERQSQAQKVFSLLCSLREGLSYNDLSRLTGLRINAICGRMAELRKIELSDGDLLIQCVETRRDEVTGVVNMVWRVNPSYFAPSRRLK